MRVTAVLHVRNEAEILRRSFDHILSNGLDIAVIDNESDDRTSDIIESYSNNEVSRRMVLEFDGTLNLPKLLRTLGELVATIDSDWILYQGADEILQSPRAGETLIDGIARLNKAGYTAINFHEVVFVPTSRWFSYQGKDYVDRMRYYYFFQPFYPRLMRAWRNLPGISNFLSGGHLLTPGSVTVADEDWILRHYIVRSYKQAKEKYEMRRHSKEGIERGWHSNRLNVNWARIALPPKKDLKYLPPASNEFDLSQPWKQHFWQRYVK